MKKVICYANLNCFNCPDNITDEHMQNFFIQALKETPSRPDLELVDVIIDRCNPDIRYTKREGWQKVIESCNEGSVDMVVIPATSMLTSGIVDILELLKEMRNSFNCDLHFMYEQLDTFDKELESQIQFFAMNEEYRERLKKNERKLHGNFYEANHINQEISAVPILVDNKVYEQIEKFARNYGEDVQTIMNWFLEVLVKPDNCELFEKIMKWDNVE